MMTAPSGVTVTVPEEAKEHFASIGYTEPKHTTRKK